MLRILISLTIFLTIFSQSINSNITNTIWVPPMKMEEPEPTISIKKHLENNLIDEKQLDCMSKNIYFEAAIESTAGKIAVGQVVLNRINSKYYPDTVCEVVKQGRHYSNGFPVRDRCQFSWYCDGKHDVPYPGQLWKKSQDIAKFMLTSGYEVDITDGALNYHADYIPNPRWAKETNKTVKIDRHIFYAQQDI